MAFRYQPPGHLDDLGDAARQQWHARVAAGLRAKLDELRRDEGIAHPYVFALDAVPATTPVVRVPVSWHGFPRRLRLRHPARRDMFDAGETLAASTTIGWRDRAYADPFRPLHRDQDEYLEWKAVRGAGGRVERYVFTTESPEYWSFLAEHDRAALLDCYRELVGREVAWDELTFAHDVWDRDGAGRPLLRYRAGTYNPWNPVNRDEALIHLSHPDNSLDAELDLLARASIQRLDAQGRRIADRRRLACCGDFGNPDRHSDPTIGFTVHALVGQGYSVTAADPVGIYLGGLDTGRLSGPRGEPVDDWWVVTRGQGEHAVRAELRPPPGATFGVSDLRVKGGPLTHGGQLAELINVVLYLGAVKRSLPPPPPRRCSKRCDHPAGADPDGKVTHVDAGAPRRPGMVDATAAVAPGELVLDGEDIQSHILLGFGRVDVRAFALLAQDATVLRRVLAQIAPRVTHVAGTLRARRDHRAAVARGQAGAAAAGTEQAGAAPALDVAVALTRHGLELLGALRCAEELDDAFGVGMDATRTGDPRSATLADAATNPSAPTNWVVGGARRFHVLVLMGAREDLAGASAPLVDALRAIAGVAEIYDETGHHLEGGREHFGFVDGISQVGVRGSVELDGELVPVDRSAAADDARERGVTVCWPGQFLVGAPRWAGDPGEPMPAACAGHDLRNGSFLVFRRLRQDVPAFRDDTAQFARQLGITADALRAMIVGRTPEGRPLIGAPAPADGGGGINAFGFVRDDLLGSVCPHWAHIRKVNPRDSPTDQGDDTARLQMLRRGIPFGAHIDRDAGADRGLLFLAYQRSIGRQFEVLNSDWMNQHGAPFGTGLDVMVGQRIVKGLHSPRTFLVESRSTQVHRQWVIPTGGAYLFAPGLSTLRRWSAVR